MRRLLEKGYSFRDAGRMTIGQVMFVLEIESTSGQSRVSERRGEILRSILRINGWPRQRLLELPVEEIEKYVRAIGGGGNVDRAELGRFIKAWVERGDS